MSKISAKSQVFVLNYFGVHFLPGHSVCSSQR